jgi:hypothetical protein
MLFSVMVVPSCSVHSVRCVICAPLGPCVVYFSHIRFIVIFNFWCLALALALRYTPSDQGLPILSEGARECLHRTMALEGWREGKAEAALTLIYSCIAFVSTRLSLRSSPPALIDQTRCIYVLFVFSYY